MNCQEIQSLWGLYHDLELDQAQTQQIRGHLATCAKCGQFYKVQDRLAHSLELALKRNAGHQASWPSDAAVRQAFQTNEPQADRLPSPKVSLASWLVSFGKAVLWPSPKYYAALATVWVIMLGINFTMIEDAPPSGASAQGQVTVTQTRSSLREYQRTLQLELATKENSEVPSTLIQLPRSQPRQRSTTEPAPPKDEPRVKRSILHTAQTPATVVPMNPVAAGVGKLNEPPLYLSFHAININTILL